MQRCDGAGVALLPWGRARHRRGCGMWGSAERKDSTHSNHSCALASDRAPMSTTHHPSRATPQAAMMMSATAQFAVVAKQQEQFLVHAASIVSWCVCGRWLPCPTLCMVSVRCCCLQQVVDPQEFVTLIDLGKLKFRAILLQNSVHNAHDSPSPGF